MVLFHWLGNLKSFFSVYHVSNLAEFSLNWKFVKHKVTCLSTSNQHQSIFYNLLLNAGKDTLEKTI